MTSTIIQISKELEESSRVHGASWIQTFQHIWLPLLRAGFIGGWLLLFVVGVRELTSVIFLYTADSHILSTIFFRYWFYGRTESAAVLGLIQAAIIFIGLVIVTFVGRPKGVAAV